MFGSFPPSPLVVSASKVYSGGRHCYGINPLPPGSAVRLAFWLKEKKLSAMGKVITSTPGYGNGVQFTEMSESDKAVLKDFVGSVVRIKG